MKARLAVISFIAFAAVCVAAQTATSNSAPGFDFSKIKTFHVRIGTSWGNPTNEEHAVQAVSEELRSKGWTQTADESTADADVVIHGATEAKHTLHDFYAGRAGGEDYAGQQPMGTRKISFTAGSGVIDIFDAKTKKLIFRGTAEDEISEKGGQENQEKIDNGVKKIFKDFPPK